MYDLRLQVNNQQIRRGKETHIVIKSSKFIKIIIVSFFNMGYCLVFLILDIPRGQVDVFLLLKSMHSNYIQLNSSASVHETFFLDFYI